MTSNQIRYLDLQETKRANEAREAETNRYNTAQLSLRAQELQEAARANAAREAETATHNRATEGLSASQLEELIRANKANEGLKTEDLLRQQGLTDAQILKVKAELPMDALRAVAALVTAGVSVYSAVSKIAGDSKAKELVSAGTIPMNTFPNEASGMTITDTVAPGVASNKLEPIVPAATAEAKSVPASSESTSSSGASWLTMAGRMGAAGATLALMLGQRSSSDQDSGIYGQIYYDAVPEAARVAETLKSQGYLDEGTYQKVQALYKQYRPSTLYWQQNKALYEAILTELEPAVAAKDAHDLGVFEAKRALKRLQASGGKQIDSSWSD